MDRYIHLCFLKQHPMEYIAEEEGRIDPVWLEIRTAILDNDGVLYSPGVSNSSEMIFYKNDEAVRKLDLEILFKYIDWHKDNNLERRQEAEKYEILIPDGIPISMITRGL